MIQKNLPDNIVTNIKKIVVTILTSKIFEKFWPWLTRNYVPIFMLHRIEDKSRQISGHSSEMLEELLRSLSKEGFNFISLQNLVDKIRSRESIPEKSVVFTMDDGYLEQGSIAAPIFIKYKCPLTIFLISDYMDGVNWPWDFKLRYLFFNTNVKLLVFEAFGREFNYPLVSYDERYDALRDFRNFCKNLDENDLHELLIKAMAAAKLDISDKAESDYLHLTWEDALELEKNGIDFAPHSVSHRILANLSDESVKTEINASWNRLQEKLDNPKNIFCYPTGRFNKDFSVREIDIIKEAGFNAAVSANHGYMNLREKQIDNDSLYRIKRISLPYEINDALLYCVKFELIRNVFGVLTFKCLIARLLRLNCANENITIRLALQIKLYKILYILGKYDKYKQINFNKVKRIIFLCTGNVCRSAFAEWYAKKHNTSIEFMSYGTDAQEGRKPHFMASYVGKKSFNVEMLKHKTSNIRNHNFRDDDLVIGMEPSQLAAIKEEMKENGAQCTLLGLWIKKPTPLLFDPYDMGEEQFIECFNLIREAIDNIIEKINA